MSKELEIYKCELCGNIVEVVHGAGGALTCCGQEMALLTENSVDAAQEKHVPVVSQVDGGYLVKMGEVAHPMADDHYIEWIEIVAGDQTYCQFLNPGDAPEATFKIDSDNITARAYCNLHGLWEWLGRQLVFYPPWFLLSGCSVG